MAHHPQYLPVWYYNTNIQQWTSADPSILHNGRSQRPQILRVVTYNILLARDHQSLRSEHLCTILQNLEANIICLQEVKNVVLHKLISQPWVQHRYLLSDVDGRTFVDGPHTYGVLMLIDKSLDVQQLASFSFPTRLGRQLLLAQIQTGTETLLVGTVHLESRREGTELRPQQLQICQSVFDSYATNHPNVTRLLMGDFNFDPHWPESAVHRNILRHWHDLWPTLMGPKDPGHTYKDRRLDRIMFQSSRVNPIKIRTFGKRPIGQYPTEQTASADAQRQHQRTGDIFTSDHFGLMADFDLSDV